MAKSKKEGVGHVQDSPNDPVFVPNFDEIESLKKKMTQESLTPDRLTVVGGAAYRFADITIL